MQTHWLRRPQAIRRLWQGFIVILVLVVVAEVRVVHDAHFAVERWFGFHAAYGFIACGALVLVAKALGLVLKRPDSYYAEARDERKEHD